MLKVAKRTKLLMQPRQNHVQHFTAFRNASDLHKTECARAKFIDKGPQKEHISMNKLGNTFASRENCRVRIVE